MKVPKAPMTTPRPTSSAAATAVIRRSGLPHAAEVGGQVSQRLLRNRLHQHFERLEARIPRAALVRLEQQHLLQKVARGLSAEIGDDLRGIAPPVRAVTDG